MRILLLLPMKRSRAGLDGGTGASPGDVMVGWKAMPRGYRCCGLCTAISRLYIAFAFSEDIVLAWFDL